MPGWTQCPSCRLKHTARPDGLCPRCGQSVSGLGAAPPSVAAPAAAPTYDTYAAPAPATARPDLEIGRFLSDTFSTWSRNAGAIVPLVLLANAPVALAIFRAYAQFPGEPTKDQILESVPYWTAMLINLLINPVELFGVAHAGVRRMRGDAVSLGELLGASARRYFPVLAFWLLLLLAVAGSACTIVVPFILLTAWAAALPAMSEEGLGPIEALRRSWHLTRGRRWRVFGGFFLLQLIMGLGVLVLQGGLALVRAGGAVSGGTAGALEALDTTLQAVAASIVTTGLAVAYRHLRDAREGPAVAHLERVFE